MTLKNYIIKIKNIYNLFIKYIYLNTNKKYDENEDSEAFKKDSIDII